MQPLRLKSAADKQDFFRFAKLSTMFQPLICYLQIVIIDYKLRRINILLCCVGFYDYLHSISLFILLHNL
jgi:hypothetical protein